MSAWVIAGVVGALVTAAALYRLVRDHRRHKATAYPRGTQFTQQVLAGAYDADVRNRLGLTGEEMTQEYRVEYVRSMTEESRHFGQFDEFDQGAIDALPRDPEYHPHQQEILDHIRKPKRRITLLIDRRQR